MVGLLACATACQHLCDVDDVVNLGGFADADAGIPELAGVLVAGEHTLADMLRCTT
jgi:hypothetical protein